MSNKFLNNVQEGENSWWRYLLTILLTWGLSNIISGFFLAILLIFYMFSSGNLSVDFLMQLVNNLESDPILLFSSIFISFSLSLVFFIISMKAFHKRTMMSLVNVSEKYDVYGKSISWIKRVRWNKLLKGAGIWLAFLLILEVISYISNPNDFAFNFNDGIYLMVLLFIIAIPIQVTFEELFFRGYLNQAISIKIKNPIIIILISSVIFSLGHIFNGGDNLIYMIQNVSITFIVGMIFSVATLVTEGIELAIGAHLINNFFSFIIHTSEGSLGGLDTVVQSSASTDPWLELLFTIFAFLIFSLIMFLYKKEKILKALDIK